MKTVACIFIALSAVACELPSDQAYGEWNLRVVSRNIDSCPAIGDMHIGVFGNWTPGTMTVEVNYDRIYVAAESDDGNTLEWSVEEDDVLTTTVLTWVRGEPQGAISTGDCRYTLESLHN